MKCKTVIFSVFIGLCLLPITTFSQTQSTTKARNNKTAAIEREILRLEEVGRVKALSGDSNWDDLMADGAYMIQGDGTTTIYQKGQNLSSLRPKSFILSDLIVRVYADTAIATGLADVSSETPDKKPFSFKMRYLNVWRKVGAGWRIAVSERTMVRPYNK